MSGICKNTPAVTSAAQRDQIFPDSVLPAANVGRQRDGTLTRGALQSVYSDLERRGKLITLAAYQKSLNQVADDERNVTEEILNNLGRTETETMKGIESEFCFYYQRYKYALEDLFTYIVSLSSGSSLTAEQRTEVNTRLQTARGFNQKLNDLIQITNYIAKKNAEEMRKQNGTINRLNSRISTTYGALRQHASMLKSEESALGLRKEMVAYSQQKNLSANNLLSFYGFMNLVALGLLFYISRS